MEMRTLSGTCLNICQHQIFISELSPGRDILGELQLENIELWRSGADDMNR